MPGKLPDRPYTDMMEYEAFLQWRAAEHVKFRYDTLRKVEHKRIITTMDRIPLWSWSEIRRTTPSTAKRFRFGGPCRWPRVLAFPTNTLGR